MKKAIFISGVIGSGKTTLAKSISEKHGLELLNENIKNESILPYIRKFYKDFDSENILKVQKHFIEDSKGLLSGLSNERVYVFDTFPFKSQRIFVESLYLSYFLDRDQFEELNSLLDSVEDFPKIDFLHIHCDTPSDLFDRIYSRGSFEVLSFNENEPNEKFSLLINSLDRCYLNNLVTSKTVFSLEDKLEEKINKFLTREP